MLFLVSNKPETMRKLIVLAFAALLTFGCGEKKRESKTKVQEEKKNVPAFSETQSELAIQDLPLATKDDTISYALGVAWSNGLATIGVSKVSYAFYHGAHDYMVQNRSFVTFQQASERIDKDVNYLKKDTDHKMDPAQKIKDIQLASTYDTLSYIWAYAWMRGAKEIGVGKITPALMLGLTKGLASDTSLFTYRKADRYLRRHVELLREQKYYDIKKKNDDWLVANKSKKDVVTLSSGLQYKILKDGKGKSPKADDVIVCHYIGKLIDDTVFESSYDNGEPLKAYPSGVIVGWREALPKMKVGSKWEIYVPYKLGYGSGGTKEKVPPFSTLIYELELLDVQKAPQ
jgi:FKBP-type peptidyl-prolyl cis-trans isomerase